MNKISGSLRTEISLEEAQNEHFRAAQSWAIALSLWALFYPGVKGGCNLPNSCVCSRPLPREADSASSTANPPASECVLKDKEKKVSPLERLEQASSC